eukprot:6428034-Pyramimonas_sp.AAC.1
MTAISKFSWGAFGVNGDNRQFGWFDPIQLLSFTEPDAHRDIASVALGHHMGPRIVCGVPEWGLREGGDDNKGCS